MERVQGSDIYSKKISKKFKIKDSYNRIYTIEDFDRFSEHIFKYHSKGSSIHEENGHVFEINDAFREKINKFKRTS